MPIAAAAVSAHISNNKRAATKKLPGKFLHLQVEKKKLEHELTTKFPSENDIKFNQVRDLLMMNGFVSSFKYLIAAAIMKTLQHLGETQSCLHRIRRHIRKM
jgi:hypothetical protein